MRALASREGRRGRGRSRDHYAASCAISYREEEDWNKLADLLRIEAEGAEDKATRLELLKEAAGLHLEKRNDPVAADPAASTKPRSSTPTIRSSGSR